MLKMLAAAPRSPCGPCGPAGPVGPATEDGHFIVLQSTTSTRNSGLLAAILPIFEEKSGIKVRVVAVGTGQAIKNAVRGDGDVLLEANEKFIITVTLTTALSTPLKEYTTFTIEVKPAVGAALIFERTTPGVIDDVMDLR